MNSNELRTAFLRFFESKGHKVIPSSSLIPHGDPTLLLTNAGMVQVKPYFLGEAVPPRPRLASCQKCFRTTDIELVGDSTHLTFFEMLGNFSVGDYFKKEATSWAWEFVIQWLKLSPERLWMTIYLDDDEAFDCWRQIGIPEDRILRFGEEDNFWGPAGDSGPCGPCSEIFYDFGEEVGCGKPTCVPNCGCARFSEIWNLVFTQYNQDRDGNRTPLTKPSIDTGMGLERTLAAVEGKTSVYDTDLFTPLLACVSELADKKYGTGDDTDNAIRVVVEHSRGIAFLIADGVMPSNEGRGYVLRRLLRRASLFGLRLGLDKPFLSETAMTTIKQMGQLYPELVQRQDFILKVIEQEESRFSETLKTGLELLDEIMDKAASQVKDKITGEDAFRLYDTYGFPVELTTEIATGSGFSVDLDGFEKEMAKQRERAKATQKFVYSTARFSGKGDLTVKATVVTEFVGYNEISHRSLITSILVDDETIEGIYEGQEASIILESTPFYGEMGGQVGDTGEIRGSAGRFSVTNTVRIPPDIIVHQGHVIEGRMAVGDTVEAEVDKERRLDIARNHTATHLLQMALRQELGEHIQQRGSLVAPDQFRFDFSHLIAMTREEIEKVNHIVNERIRQNLAVYDEEIPYTQAIEEGAIALFDEKYGDVVRVLKIGRPPVSTELCGGTHVTTTGEIGFFHILSESSIGAGLRRIEAVTGRGAERYIDKRLSDLDKIAEFLETERDLINDKVYNMLITSKNLVNQMRTQENQLAILTARLLLTQIKLVKGVNVIIDKIPPTRINTLRVISDYLRHHMKSGIIVLGTLYEDRPLFLVAVTQDLVTKGYNAGEIVKKVAEVTGGGGGGKATLAQGGGTNKGKLDEALKLVKTLV